jgi:hypothetical protein
LLDIQAQLYLSELEASSSIRLTSTYNKEKAQAEIYFRQKSFNDKKKKRYRYLLGLETPSQA